MPLVTCEYNKSELYRGTYEVCAREARRLKSNGRVICLQCSRKSFLGRENPNCKHNFDDNFFEEIDTEFKAYYLGLIASDGCILKRGFQIFLHKDDVLIFEIFRKVFCPGLKITKRKGSNGGQGAKGVTVNSQKISEDLCKHLYIKPGKKSHSVKFPEHLTDEMKWHFLRGYFDGDGSVMTTRSHGYPRCNIVSNSLNMLKSIKEFVGVPSSICSDHLEFCGRNCIDFLGKLYENCKFYLERKRSRYIDWSVWRPTRPERRHQYDNFFCSRTDARAVLPKKNKATDSGFDITIIEKLRENDAGFRLYDTGIKVSPAYGYYFDVVPRSSFFKTGHIMANSVGVIDASYCGTIMIAVIKIDKDAEDLKLPGRYFQMIPRQIDNMELIELTEEEWEEKILSSSRGADGFGSSGDS